MVNNSRKCRTEDIPVSGVLKVKALFLPSKVFSTPYVYHRNCTTLLLCLPVFPMPLMYIGKYRSYDFHSTAFQTQTSKQRWKEGRRKVWGCIRGQNHVFNPKLDAKQPFFRESLAVKHWELGGVLKPVDWMTFETTVEAKVHSWQRPKTGILQMFKQKFALIFWIQNSGVINSHANVHFPAFLSSLLNTPLTLPTASPSCLCSYFSF